MKRINRLVPWLLSASLLLPAIGFSADATTELTSETENGITYLSGGIGEGQQQAMRDLHRDYNLRLVFAVKNSGAYLADIKVKIQDARGKQVLETVSPGPLFYVKLPQGKYRVMAKYHEKALTQSITVKKTSPKEVGFYWDQE